MNYQTATKKALTAIAKEYGTASLLGEQNAKTVKGAKKGVLTGILYMMPDDTLCPMSRLAGCREACLVSAGRAAYTPGIGMSRAGRTKFFHGNREAFMALLKLDIQRIIKKAAKQGKTPAIRLNGTSDVDWTNIEMSIGKNVFETFPNVQFYDYTKSPSIIRKAAQVKNWHITASYSEAATKYRDVISKAANEYDANMAVVFDSKRMPETFAGKPVINGDETDLRFFDEKGVIVGLSAKGQAKQDVSGFVIASDRT